MTSNDLLSDLINSHMRAFDYKIEYKFTIWDMLDSDYTNLGSENSNHILTDPCAGPVGNFIVRRILMLQLNI